MPLALPAPVTLGSVLWYVVTRIQVGRARTKYKVYAIGYWAEARRRHTGFAISTFALSITWVAALVSVVRMVGFAAWSPSGNGGPRLA